MNCVIFIGPKKVSPQYQNFFICEIIKTLISFFLNPFTAIFGSLNLRLYIGI